MLDLMNPEERPEQIQRYGVYTIRTATEDGVVYSRSFIVVRNGYGVISRFTRLQDYAGFKVYKPISSNAEKKLYYICGMLNYVLVDNGRMLGIRHVFGITAEMLQEYFRNGEAMTYETYRTRFRELVDGHLRPYLIKSSDPELRLYGQLLYENQLGTHALRHWFTVQLVLRGEDIGSIQYWRGDSSPESSFLYLQNKGDITRELEASSDRLVTMLVSGWGDFEDDTV